MLCLLPSVVILCVIMLSGYMPSVVILSVIMLSGDMQKFRYSECHFAQWLYFKGRYSVRQLCRVLFCRVPLWWVSLCWVHYADCRYAERRYAERRYAERHYNERRHAKCRYAECRYTERLSKHIFAFSESIYSQNIANSPATNDWSFFEKKLAKSNDDRTFENSKWKEVRKFD